MRLCDGVIVRERMEYKGHHHVQKPRAFRKAQTISELVLTPLGRTLTKSRGREKETIRKALKQFEYSKYIEMEYVCMGNA